MKIYVADPCGFCYGVKRAIHVAELQAKGYNDSIATLGELVHNPRVVEKLKQQGVECKEKLAQFAAGDTVIFRSHGVGPALYEEARQRELKVLMCGKHRKRLPNWRTKAVLSSLLGRSVILRCKVSRLGQAAIL